MKHVYASHPSSRQPAGNRLIALCSVLMVSLLCLGCRTSDPLLVEDDFGKSVRNMVEQQIEDQNSADNTPDSSATSSGTSPGTSSGASSGTGDSHSTDTNNETVDEKRRKSTADH